MLTSYSCLATFSLPSRFNSFLSRFCLAVVLLLSRCRLVVISLSSRCRLVPSRFVSFRLVSFRFVSSRFVSFCLVSSRFVSCYRLPSRLAWTFLRSAPWMEPPYLMSRSGHSHEVDSSGELFRPCCRRNVRIIRIIPEFPYSTGILRACPSSFSPFWSVQNTTRS